MTTYTAKASLQAPTIATLEAQAGTLALALASDTHTVESIELEGIEAVYSTPPTGGAPMPWRAQAIITLAPVLEEEPPPVDEPVQETGPEEPAP